MRLYMLTSDLTSLDLPQFSQCMDASEESWHRLFFIYLFFGVSAPSTFFLVDTAASTPQEKNWDRCPFADLFLQRKEGKTESCQGGL